MGSGEKCLTCRIVELITQGTFLCVLAFLSFNVVCDVQSIKRDVKEICKQVRLDSDRRTASDGPTVPDKTLIANLPTEQEVEEILDEVDKISTTIKNDGQKDDNE